MPITPDKDAQEVIEWWKEYGFKRDGWERSDVVPLFNELLNKLDTLSEEGQMQVFDWIDENGY